MDPSGLKLWLIFLAVWVTFWAAAGGIVCHVLRRRGLKGALFGAVLAVVGIMLVLVAEDDSADTGPTQPTESNT